MLAVRQGRNAKSTGASLGTFFRGRSNRPPVFWGGDKLEGSK